MHFPFASFAQAGLLVLVLPVLGYAQAVTPAASPSPAFTPAPTPQVGGALGSNASQIKAVGRIRQLVRDVETNSDNIKSKGSFGAQLWLVAGQQFFQDWRKPDSPTIVPVEIAPRGDDFYTVVIFYGMARDAGGLSNVSYDVTVHRPDGTVYSEKKDLVGWQDLSPTDLRSLELGRDRVALNIATEDPVGLYTVDVLVHDNVGRVDLPLKQTFVVQ